MSYEPVIGLEIHLELATESKMFCRCPADHFGQKPNTQICPVCLGLPGALPYPNRRAINWTLLLGLALNCWISDRAQFDRKNYFYPDLPKGYQISQYSQPFCRNGHLQIGKRKIGINRVHLEEDTGKLVHRTIGGKKYSLIDFNRSGVPLVEIVSEPEIRSTEELIEFGRKIQQIVRYLDISGADMEKGQMRFELNISLRPKGSQELPAYRTEVKNLNSFKFLAKATRFEIKRQTEALKKGQALVQETRGFDDKREVTVSQRGKEEAHDYRYFPEPDIPPFEWEKSEIERLKELLPELPDQKIARFKEELDLDPESSLILVKKRKTADYFETAVKAGRKEGIKPEEIAKIIINKRVKTAKVTPYNLVKMVVKRKTRKKLTQSGTERLVIGVVAENPEEVKRYQQGKTGLIEFFVGQVMKESKGRVDPNLTRKILVEKLRKKS